MEPDLVIFDCDGVLVDSEALACQSLAETMTRHGLPCTIDDVFTKFLGRGFAAVEDYHQKMLGLPVSEDFLADLRSSQFALFRSHLRPLPHVPEMLSEFKRPFCLATSSDPERLQLTLEVTGLGVYFVNRIYHAAMVERAKPAPDLFLLAAKGMGASPSRTLVVEDSLTGVQAGKAAGMNVWAFTGGSHYAGRHGIGAVLRAAGADRIIDSMSALMRPVITTVQRV
jgi:HAD superfamily hydrolase (TIGR01509 family)